MRIGVIKRVVFPLLVCLTVTGCWKSSEQRAAEHYESGLALMEAGDYGRAMVEFRNTIKFAENNIDARRQMAQIHLLNGNRRGAYGDYLRLVERRPNDVEGRTALSELAFLARNWEEFERHADAAIALAPELPKVKAIDIGAQYRNAVIAEDNSTRNKTLVAAETLADDLPDNDILRQVLIDGYVSQERYELALEQIDKSIADTPNDKSLYTSKMEILNRMGRTAEVEAELRAMIARFPDDDNIKATLLRYLMSRGQTDQAEAFLRAEAENASPKDKKSAIADLIRFMLRLKGPDEALAELNSELAKAPDQDLLRTLRGSINFDAGRRDEGIAELQDILSQETTTLTAVEQQNVKVALARMLVNTGNEVGARKLVEEVLEADSAAVGALKMQAAWLTDEDDTDGAISALRTALDQAPEDADAMTLMAQAYQRAGNRELMMNFLSLAVEASNSAPDKSMTYARALVQDEKYLQAETTLIGSLRITPGNVGVLGLLGNVYLRLEDFPRARQVVETLRNIDNETANANANAIEAELLQKEFGQGEVMNFLEGLVAQGGNQANAASLAILRTRLQEGKLDEALAMAKDLLEKAPDNAAFQNALALTYAATGDYEQAEGMFKNIIEQNDRNLGAWLQLARLQAARGDQDGSMAVLEDGLKAVPDAPDLLWGKASLLQERGDIDGAIGIYEDLYEDFSQSAVVANNLASLLSVHRADDPAAIERAQVIARRLQGAELPAFRDTYGWLQHLAGNNEEALSYLEPAAAGLPNDVTVQIHLGMVYAAVGQNDKALEQLRRAVSMAGPLGTEKLLDKARAKISELETQ